MNAADFRKLLIELGACQEALDWSEGKSLAEFWLTCGRGDWMCWLLSKMAGKPGWPSEVIADAIREGRK